MVLVVVSTTDTPDVPLFATIAERPSGEIATPNGYVKPPMVCVMAFVPVLILETVVLVPPPPLFVT